MIGSSQCMHASSSVSLAGDDQHRRGYEGALTPWLAALWSTLASTAPSLGLPTIADPDPDSHVPMDPPRFAVEGTGAQLPPCSSLLAAQREAIAAARSLDRLSRALDGLEDPSTANDLSSESPVYSTSNPFFAPLVVNARLTPAGADRDVRHLELDLGSSGPNYEPGDVAAIFPHVSDSVVIEFCERVQMSPDAEICVRPSGSSGAPPTSSASPAAFTCRLGSLVRGALDVAGAPPRRYLFEVLARFTDAEHERERLEYFASAEGIDDLYQYCHRERRSLLEILQDFPGCRPPLAWLLQLSPRLQPRYFSISSAAAADGPRLSLTAAIVDFTTPWKRRREGLCTKRWLAGLVPGTPEAASVPLWIEKGSMALHPAAPLILVGPGTGLAPMRSFLRHRAATQAGAPSVLIFGCRNEAVDFLYSAELEGYVREGRVLAAQGGLLTAFSRDTPGQKVYVQQRIRENAARLWELLAHQGAVVYVSGSANKMPADVAEAFRAVAEVAGGMGPAEAELWLKRMVAGKRYFVEAWS